MAIALFTCDLKISEGAEGISSPPALRGASRVFFEILTLPYSWPWNDFVHRADLVIFSISSIQWGGGDQYPVDMGKFTVNN